MDTDQIVEEIRELRFQYEAEVGSGGRRAWPKSIKDRVLRLHASGMKSLEVSRRTGISYHSMLNWRRDAGLVRPKAKSNSKFHSLTVKDTASMRTVTDEVVVRAVTVQIPSVGEVKFASPADFAEFLKSFQLGGFDAV